MECISLFINHLNNDKKLNENSVKIYKTVLKQFLNYLKTKNKDFLDINIEDIEYFVNVLNLKEISLNSLIQYVSCIKEFYDFLYAYHIIKNNPIANFNIIKSKSKSRKRIHYLTKEKIDILFSKNKERKDFFAVRDQAIMELLYCTGINVSELTSITYADCNFEKRFIRIKGKSVKERIIPFSESCRDKLDTYTSDVRVKILKNNSFPNHLFLNYKGEKLTTRGINEIFKVIKEKTKFKYELNALILRNSFAMNLILNGADLKLVKDFMGYKNLDFVERFKNVDEKEMLREYQKFFKIK